MNQHARITLESNLRTSSVEDSLSPPTGVCALNESHAGACKHVFKPYAERLDRERYVESEDDDPQLLIHIPFTSPVKIKASSPKQTPPSYHSPTRLPYTTLLPHHPPTQPPTPTPYTLRIRHIFPTRHTLDILPLSLSLSLSPTLAISRFVHFELSQGDVHAKNRFVHFELTQGMCILKMDSSISNSHRGCAF